MSYLRAFQSPKVVINEIAYRGTTASSSDEWLELYNTTSSPIDLSGWTLSLDDQVLPLSGTIEAYGFYLLERTDEQTVSSISSDYLYTGSLTDSGVVLTLKDSSGVQIDQVSEFYIDLASPPEGFSDRSTMEKINPLLPGDSAVNWRINNQQETTGLDASGSSIFGTPRSQNSHTLRAFGYGYMGIVSSGAPAPPQNFSAQQIDHRIQLSWDISDEFTFYQLDHNNSKINLGNTDTHIITPSGPGQLEFSLTATDLFLIESEPTQAAVNFSTPQLPSEGQILINELRSLPPSGEKEWVELYNPTTSWWDLSICMLHDKTGLIHSFAPTDAIGPGGFFIADLSAQKLNDSGDTVTLFCQVESNQVVIDTIFYGSSSPEPSYESTVGYEQSAGYLPPSREANTLGRTPDGGSLWFLISIEDFPSKNAPNPDLTPVPGVISPQIFNDDANVRVTWTNPSFDSFAGTNIYLSNFFTDDEFILVDTIPPEENQVVLQGLPFDLNQIRLIPFNASGLEAQGIEVSTVFANLLGLVISEVLPNPKTGNPEFIELYNASGDFLDLSFYDLVVSNASNDISDPSGSFTFFDFVLFPDEHFAIEIDPDFYDFRLSNISSQIAVFDEEGFPIASVDYIAPPKGISIIFDDELQSLLHHPTPNGENIFTNADPQAVITIQGSGSKEGCSVLNFNTTGANSIDADDDELSYSWVYRTSSGTTLLTSEDKNPLSFKFTEDMGGPFEVELTVEDSFGGRSTVVEKDLVLGVCKSGKRSTAAGGNAAPIVYPRHIEINEVFPNPSGRDTGVEFVELYNSGAVAVDLTNWRLGAKTKRRLKELTIEPGQYLAIHKVTLRNGGDSIQLLNPNKEQLDIVTYPESEEGQSYSKDESGALRWTIPTPNQTNDFPFQVEDIYLQRSAKVLIHRFLANPDGSDKDKEWIEIMNSSKETVSLAGWQLDNRQGGSKPHLITNITLQPQEVHRFTSDLTGITLRNTADQIRLLNPAAQQVDILEWKTPVASGLVLTREDLIQLDDVSPDCARVMNVVDGDTIDIFLYKARQPGDLDCFSADLESKAILMRKRERVRLIGVDTPETVHPFKPLEKFGKEASNYTKAQLSGQVVQLEYDLTKRGKYGRLLAYIHLEERHFNAELVRKGFAFAYLKYPFQYREEFRQLQLQAEQEKVGMWATEEVKQIREKQELVEDEELKELEVIEEKLKELEPEEKEEGEVEKTIQKSYDQQAWEFIQLNEVLPNPAGKDSEGGEYIEIKNLSDLPADLTDWKIVNGKEKTLLELSGDFNFESAAVPVRAGHDLSIQKPALPGGGIIAFNRLKRSIKNKEETILLLDPLENIRDQFSYQVSAKDDQAWSRNPITTSWQLLPTGTPGKENEVVLITQDMDSDKDGISDKDELAMGMNPSSLDSDNNGWPDDFDLMKKSGYLSPSVEYEQYLSDSLVMTMRQTKRTLRFMGTTRPYTSIQLVLYSSPQTVLIPVNDDGSWEYKVDVGLEKGAHHAEVFAIDYQGRKSMPKEHTPFELASNLNASKLSKLRKSKPKKSKAPTPLYRLAALAKDWLQAEVVKFSPQDQTLVLSNGSSYKLSHIPSQLTQFLAKPNTSVRYTLADDQTTIKQIELIKSAHASYMGSTNTDEPLYMFAFLAMCLTVCFVVGRRYSP